MSGVGGIVGPRGVTVAGGGRDVAQQEAVAVVHLAEVEESRRMVRSRSSSGFETRPAMSPMARGLLASMVRMSEYVGGPPASDRR